MNGVASEAEARSTAHLLNGLEADNLLAFLALLGLLRTLDTVRPQWRARVAWRGTPLALELNLASAVSGKDIIAGADAGIRKLGETYRFDRGNLKYSAEEFRELAREAASEPERARLVAALGSDGAVKSRKREALEVEPTPLCAMFGQGHQYFLSRLSEIVERSQTSESDLERALFEPWRYDDDSDSFRWDPIEDRRYAHQFGNPSEAKNKIGTVTGANRLAAVGFGVLTSAPTASGLVTLGVSGARRERDVCWPLVGVPTSLSGYIALLAHPWLGDEQSAPELAAYGVLAVARARRYQVDKYFNFERARLQFL